jgi:hypothetical protein
MLIRIFDCIGSGRYVGEFTDRDTIRDVLKYIVSNGRDKHVGFSFGGYNTKQETISLDVTIDNVWDFIDSL